MIQQIKLMLKSKYVFLIAMLFLLSCCNNIKIKKECGPLSKEQAIAFAEQVWINTYKYSEMELNDYKPYKIELRDDIWIIIGTWNHKNDKNSAWVGGVPRISIKASNCEIIYLNREE